MLISFLILFFVTLTIAQFIKLYFRREWLHKYFFQELVWVFIYGSGPPSAHTAVLTSSLIYMGFKVGFDSAIFIAILISSILWIYEMYMQRLRFYTISRLVSQDKVDQEEVVKKWLKIKSKNPLKATAEFFDKFNVNKQPYRDRIISEWKDLAGHDFMDLIWGFLVGLVVSLVYVYLGY